MIFCQDVPRTEIDHPFFRGKNEPHRQLLSDLLMTYVFFNWDVAYVQGMGDLLSPILIVLNDEVDAFWCYKVRFTWLTFTFERFGGPDGHLCWQLSQGPEWYQQAARTPPETFKVRSWYLICCNCQIRPLGLWIRSSLRI